MILVEHAPRNRLKSVYQRGSLPVKANKVIAHIDDDDDGHGDNDDDGHVSGSSHRAKSRRFNSRSNSNNQSADKGLHVISKLFNSDKQ